MMAMSLQQRPLPFFNGSLLFSSSNRQFPHRSTTIFRWSFGRDQGSSLVTRRTKGRAFRILANPNVSSGKGNSGKEVIMVDPLEAKRLAAKQMVQIKAKEKAKVKKIFILIKNLTFFLFLYIPLVPRRYHCLWFIRAATYISSLEETPN
ncbi:uncharacterized protein [Gossypium hirsutum]|uniref:Uncharacterized protein isoform X2 n=1 Tax=Gossypium hirsutum TaxID=3635 RepID=A0ABM3A2Z5_GOSHI|nr:uncharacterized protein LOC107907468 isoform X2 [Gossypium hirsutum]